MEQLSFSDFISYNCLVYREEYCWIQVFDANQPWWGGGLCAPSALLFNFRHYNIYVSLICNYAFFTVQNFVILFLHFSVMSTFS